MNICNVAICWQVQKRKQSILSTFIDLFPCMIRTVYNKNSDSSIQDFKMSNISLERNLSVKL